MNPTGACRPGSQQGAPSAPHCAGVRGGDPALSRPQNTVGGLSCVILQRLIQPSKWRQLQIIRSLAAAVLAAAACVPAGAAGQQLTGGQGAPCVSCLVIGVDDSDLSSLRPLAAGSLDGVQLMLAAPPRNEVPTTTGVSVAVLVAPSAATGVSQIVFDARTTMTG